MHHLSHQESQICEPNRIRMTTFDRKQDNSEMFLKRVLYPYHINTAGGIHIYPYYRARKS